MEAQSALVRTERAGKFDPPASVHVLIAPVVRPGHVERYHALRLGEEEERPAVEVPVGRVGEERLDGYRHFLHCLYETRACDSCNRPRIDMRVMS